MSASATAVPASVEKGSSLSRDAWRRLKKNRAAVVSGVILLAMMIACIAVPELSQWRYDQADLKVGVTAPSWDHWMGTDYFGRDMMARVFFGGRISFAVGLIATFVSFFIGIAWGGVAGYFGGKLDGLMMRFVDVLYTFPFLIFVILLMVFFANDQTPVYAAWQAVLGLFVDDPKDASYFPIFQIVIIFGALGSISWLTMARIVRGQVIALRNQPFVEAARSIGVGHTALIFRHLVPNALGPIIVYTTLTIPNVMSATECDAMVARIYALTPTEAPISAPGGAVMRPDVRNNKRAMFDDVPLAAALFDRIASRGGRVGECGGRSAKKVAGGGCGGRSD